MDDSSDEEESRTSSITKRSSKTTTVGKFSNSARGFDAFTTTTSATEETKQDSSTSLDSIFANVNLNMSMDDLKKKAEQYEAKKAKAKYVHTLCSLFNLTLLSFYFTLDIHIFDIHIFTSVVLLSFFLLDFSAKRKRKRRELG